MAKKTPPKNSSKEKNTLLLFSGTMLVLMYFVGHLATYNIKEKIPPKQVLAVTTEINLPELKNPSLPPPTLSAKSAYAIDLKTKKVLFAQNEREPALPASTTKIATAIVALSHYKPTDVLTIGKISIDGQKMNLVEGEQITAQDLLYGLLVFSANDAAEALAQSYPGGRVNFINAMNQLARNLSLEKTNFTNPSGVDEYLHFSSAYDLVKLADYGIKDPLFSQIVSTEKYKAYSTDRKIVHEMKNINELLGEMPGVLGVKTGWTENSGEDLVTLYEKNGNKILMSVLGSTDRFGETKEVLEWITQNYFWGN